MQPISTKRGGSLIAKFALVVFLAATNQASATSYTFTDLGQSIAASTTATGINNSGQVVGFSQTTGYYGNQQAILWSGSTSTTLQALSGPNSNANAINSSGQVVGSSDRFGYYGPYTGWGSLPQSTTWNNSTIPTPLGNTSEIISKAYGINDSGQIVGFSGSNSSASLATLWNNGTTTYLGPVENTYSNAYAINNIGQAVGISSTGGTASHATLWDDGTTTDLGTLGGSSSYAYAINDAGKVVGSILGNGLTQHAAIWDGSTGLDLGTFGGLESVAWDINNVGQVVGYYQASDYTGRAFLWDNGNFIDLNSFLDPSSISAGWVLNSAKGINDFGWIVGEALNIHTGASHAYLLKSDNVVVSTTPLPAALPLMLSGLGVLGFASRRRKVAEV